MIETSNKITHESKRSFRVLNRQSVEETETSSKRHKISNPSSEILNYEIKRKYRRVAIDVQHVGTRLCWQLYINEPGRELGVAELVHLAKPSDFNSAPLPESASPAFENKTEPMTVDISFTSIKDSDGDTNADSNETYSYGIHGTDGKNKIQHEYKFAASSPHPEYHLVDINPMGYQGSNPKRKAPSVWSVDYDIVNAGKGTFKAILKQVNFEKNPAVKVSLDVTWAPNAGLITEAKAKKEADKEAFNKKKQREAEQAMVSAIRDRVELARAVIQRDSDDLRDEERHIVFRQVMQRLIGHVAGEELHLITTLIRSIFDVDQMLYFVAPDWWNPRMSRERGELTLPALVGGAKGETTYLSQKNRVRFGGVEGDRPNNYLVTEDSDPADMGSSLGWLLQLDGDRNRNAFLNSSWAQVVIPIAPGKELRALDWLQQDFVEGTEGLNADALGRDGKRIPKLDDNGEPVLENVGDPVLDDNGDPVLDANGDPVLNDGDPVYSSVKEELSKLATIINENNDKDEAFLAQQTLHEKGFDPLGSESFVAPDNPLDIIAQWVEVVPTKQVVAVPYVIK